MTEKKNSNPRGIHFEVIVGTFLDLFGQQHPQAVTVIRHPRVELQNGTTRIPDFELICKFPYQTDHRLIECQDREKSSQDIVDKIRSLKALSPRNRVIFVFNNEDYLSDPVRRALDADGVLYYSLIDFAVFLSKLSETLGAVADSSFDLVGLAKAFKNPPPLSYKMSAVLDDRFGIQASTKFKTSLANYSPKGDQAMLSSPSKRRW